MPKIGGNLLNPSHPRSISEWAGCTFYLYTSWQHVVLMSKPVDVLLSKLRLQLDLHFMGHKIHAWAFWGLL